MTARREAPVKGDVFLWHTEKNANVFGPVRVEVLRVSVARGWADCLMTVGASEWRKRQPLPFPDTFEWQS